MATETCWPFGPEANIRSVQAVVASNSVDADVSKFAPGLAQRQLGKSLGEWLNAHSKNCPCDGSDGGRSGRVKSKNNTSANVCSILWYNSEQVAMKPKKPSPLSQAASAMGKKGGARTLALHGAEHFSKASKARKEKARKKVGGKK